MLIKPLGGDSTKAVMAERVGERQTPGCQTARVTRRFLFSRLALWRFIREIPARFSRQRLTDYSRARMGQRPGRSSIPNRTPAAFMLWRLTRKTLTPSTQALMVRPAGASTRARMEVRDGGPPTPGSGRWEFIAWQSPPNNLPHSTPTPLTAFRAPMSSLKSTDKGTSWNHVSSTALLAIDPQNPATLFGIGPHGLEKSTDGGVNWSPAKDGLPEGPCPRAFLVDD